MNDLTLWFSAIAAFASVLSVLLMIKSNRDNRRHKKHRLEALDEEYNGHLNYIDPTGRDKVRAEINTLRKDLKIKKL